MFFEIKGIVTQLSWRGWDEKNSKPKKIEEFTQFNTIVYDSQDVKKIIFSNYSRVPFLPPEPRDQAPHIVVRIELHNRNLKLDEFLIRKGKDESNIRKITEKANALGIRVKDFGRDDIPETNHYFPAYKFFLSKVLPHNEFLQFCEDPDFVPKTNISFLCFARDSVIDDFPHLDIKKLISGAKRMHNVPVPDFIKLMKDPRVGRIKPLKKITA